MSQKKKKFLNRPFYLGGNEAMDAFIKENISYPLEALEAKKEGTVKVKLTMNHKGKVIHTEATNKLGFGLEEEAERLVKLLQFKVNKNHHVKVSFHKELNIHFKLPPKKPQPQVQDQAQPSNQVQISYNYKPAEPKPEEQKKSYSYKITKG